MKNLIIFLFGAAFGAGGTLLWLRKDIRKELENIKSVSENEDEVPFEMDEKKKEDAAEPKRTGKTVQEREKERVQYNSIINNEYSGLKTAAVTPRDEDPEAGFDETDGTIFEIDQDDFMNNESNEKEHLVYFRGDRIMTTENGTIIEKPCMLVGGEWENCIGNYAKNTAFIRNSRLTTDYEIYVEDGLYSDEYGYPESGGEDG